MREVRIPAETFMDMFREGTVLPRQEILKGFKDGEILRSVKCQYIGGMYEIIFCIVEKDDYPETFAIEIRDLDQEERLEKLLQGDSNASTHTQGASEEGN